MRLEYQQSLMNLLRRSLNKDLWCDYRGREAGIIWLGNAGQSGNNSLVLAINLPFEQSSKWICVWRGFAQPLLIHFTQIAIFCQKKVMRRFFREEAQYQARMMNFFNGLTLCQTGTKQLGCPNNSTLSRQETKVITGKIGMTLSKKQFARKVG
jgi:hypothetical protein